MHPQLKVREFTTYIYICILILLSPCHLLYWSNLLCMLPTPTPSLHTIQGYPELICCVCFQPPPPPFPPPLHTIQGYPENLLWMLSPPPSPLDVIQGICCVCFLPPSPLDVIQGICCVCFLPPSSPWCHSGLSRVQREPTCWDTAVLSTRAGSWETPRPTSCHAQRIAQVCELVTRFLEWSPLGYT